MLFFATLMIARISFLCCFKHVIYCKILLLCWKESSIGTCPKGETPTFLRIVCTANTGTKRQLFNNHVVMLLPQKRLWLFWILRLCRFCPPPHPWWRYPPCPWLPSAWQLCYHRHLWWTRNFLARNSSWLKTFLLAMQDKFQLKK